MKDDLNDRIDHNKTDDELLREMEEKLAREDEEGPRLRMGWKEPLTMETRPLAPREETKRVSHHETEHGPFFAISKSKPVEGGSLVSVEIMPDDDPELTDLSTNEENEN